jgi:hypothetical protein
MLHGDKTFIGKYHDGLVRGVPAMLSATWWKDRPYFNILFKNNKLWSYSKKVLTPGPLSYKEFYG